MSLTMVSTVIFLFAVFFVSEITAENFECPEGWSIFRDKCFHKNDVSMGTFDENLKYCKSMGGQMVTIKDAAESNHVSSLIKGNTYYLGLARLGQGWNDSWAWIDGETPEFYNWEYGVHDKANRKKEHNCVNILSSNGLWMDTQCTRRLNLFCEKKAKTQDFEKLKNETESLTGKVEIITEQVKEQKKDIENLKKEVTENKKECDTTIIKNVNEVKTQIENNINVSITKYEVEISKKITEIDQKCISKTKEIYELVEKNSIDIREHFQNITQDQQHLHNIDIEKIKNEGNKQYEKLEKQVTSLTEKSDKCNNDITEIMKEILGIKKEITTVSKDLTTKITNDISSLEAKLIKAINKEKGSILDKFNKESDALTTKLNDFSKEIRTDTEKKYVTLKEEITQVTNSIKEIVTKQIDTFTVDISTKESNFLDITNKIKVDTNRIDKRVEKISLDLKRVEDNEAKNSEKCKQNVNSIQTQITELKNTNLEKIAQLEKMIKDLDGSLNKRIIEIITTAKIIINTKTKEIQFK